MDRILGVIAGIVYILIAVGILSVEHPMTSRYGGRGFPTYHWVGWITLPVGCFFFVTNIRGFFIDRKKRLANIARCKAKREREAQEALYEDKPYP